MVTKIADLFANDIHRRIEEVIKVDQVDEEIVRQELSEYVVTDSICEHYLEILDRYRETPNKPHEGIGVWVSGFFGSGKSSFAKNLGLALENRNLMGEGSAKILGQRTRNNQVQVILQAIAEQIPTQSVIFDVSSDRRVRSGNQSITEITYRIFLKNLGYAQDLTLAELEITLEELNQLEEFKTRYRESFGKDWDTQKGKVVMAVQQASRVMHELDPYTFSQTDSWRESVGKRVDITPARLAERCIELMQRRYPNHNLVFVIDEVGQFVSRDVQKMLDLQALVQNLGRVGRGKLWLVVTSQEKLTELVGGLDDRRVELARLMDRFPLQVHLEPSDISEVTSKRVLSKNAESETLLRELFSQHRGRLLDNTRLSADIKLPELNTESFIDLYPLLPYQVDLIINVVSGLRTQGGASKHVGGANRTIIKLAQQLLIHPDVKLDEKSVGVLVRIDQIYNLVAGNIGSEIRGKIDDISKQLDHPLAQKVAKSICLLQYVRSIHRTAENIAATLHPQVDADSQLTEVKAALEELTEKRKIRLGNEGYRIPSLAEDDWDNQRSSLSPKPGDSNRIYGEIIASFWKPQPFYTFLETKVFKAGLYLNGKSIQDGNVPFYVSYAANSAELSEIQEEVRKRSQAETKEVFWVFALDEEIDREQTEVFRSKEILSRKERGAQTKDETALVTEEKQRLKRHQSELERLLKQAMLAGSIFFRGNDRSPSDQITEVGRAAVEVLSQALPEVFSRFEEAAVKSSDAKKALDGVLTTENLRSLNLPVFTDLQLIREEGGKPIFNTESGPLAEIYSRIENRTSYGEIASGRYLTDELSKEPFGWDFEAVRLLVAALLRSGKIQATSKGKVIESALSLDAKNTLTNNNLFKQTSFRTKTVVDFSQLVEANAHYEEVFGREISELEQSVVANEIRATVEQEAQTLQEVCNRLIQKQLPGSELLQEALEQISLIRSGNEELIIQTFNSAYQQLKEAIKRGAELSQSLTETNLYVLNRAKEVTQKYWPALQADGELDDSIHETVSQLQDFLAKETFFKYLPEIDQHTKKVEEFYQQRHAAVAKARATAYTEALEQLKAMSGWEQLNAEQQEQVAQPLASRTSIAGEEISIDMLKEQQAACSSFLSEAQEKVMRLVDGNRVEQVKVADYFTGGIDTEEQLEAALEGLRERCVEILADGKKIWIQ